MAIHKQDKWWESYPHLESEPWPEDLACIVFDGRTHARSELVTLLRNGADAWNAFRQSLPPVRWYRTKGGSRWTPGFLLRLAEESFRRFDFSNMNLTGCDFPRSDFSRAKFHNTQVGRGINHLTIEKRSDLSGSNFSRAEIVSVSFDWCNLANCNFSNTELNGVSLSHANMRNAKLNRCLIAAEFNDTEVSGVDFADSYFLGSFINMDLGSALNLSRINFHDHVVIDHRTLFRSGRLPDEFYRGCGLPELLVQYMPSLVETPIRFESCFISHSSIDEKFVSGLYHALQEAGVGCFFAPRDLKIGSVTRDALDAAVHANDRLLLVLSRNSIGSQWVEHEVEAALERERKEGRVILFPITIDDAVMTSEKGWAANLRRQRNIGDFRNWKNTAAYRRSVIKLLNDLSKNPPQTNQ